MHTPEDVQQKRRIDALMKTVQKDEHGYYKCPRCSVQIREQRSNLRTHIMRHHISYKPYKCTYYVYDARNELVRCHYSTPDKGTLDRHIRSKVRNIHYLCPGVPVLLVLAHGTSRSKNKKPRKAEDSNGHPDALEACSSAAPVYSVESASHRHPQIPLYNSWQSGAESFTSSFSGSSSFAHRGPVDVGAGPSRSNHDYGSLMGGNSVGVQSNSRCVPSDGFGPLNANMVQLVPAINVPSHNGVDVPPARRRPANGTMAPNDEHVSLAPIPVNEQFNVNTFRFVPILPSNSVASNDAFGTHNVASHPSDGAALRGGFVPINNNTFPLLDGPASDNGLNMHRYPPTGVSHGGAFSSRLAYPGNGFSTDNTARYGPVSDIAATNNGYDTVFARDHSSEAVAFSAPRSSYRAHEFSSNAPQFAPVHNGATGSEYTSHGSFSGSMYAPQFGRASANDVATRGPQHLSPELCASYSANRAYDANTPQFAVPPCNPMYGGTQSTNISQTAVQEDRSTWTVR
ncbi:hypothetical protein K474DRAFT_1178822 [Panus rudis PR-1116 ss-1]|nr:hypothetical protein K474DRAFT_1178822 [Panus rudis PR-1116 ss-1]